MLLHPGRIFIQHISFEEEGKDEFGYPITKYLDNGDPIVKDLTLMAVPYLYDEVLAIINYIKDNPIKKK